MKCEECLESSSKVTLALSNLISSCYFFAILSGWLSYVFELRRMSQLASWPNICWQRFSFYSIRPVCTFIYRVFAKHVTKKLVFILIIVHRVYPFMHLFTRSSDWTVYESLTFLFFRMTEDVSLEDGTDDAIGGFIFVVNSSPSSTIFTFFLGIDFIFSFPEIASGVALNYETL